jgi:hypothetical protein
MGFERFASALRALCERFASALRALCERFALFFLKNIALCDRTPDIKPSNTREKKK